jgi:tetratricopeptide (TPR) repeat protein
MKLYAAAVKFYTLAITHQTHPNTESSQSTRAYINRSQAYLNLDKPYSAHLDALNALKMSANNEKALFRLGKSYYAMRQFENARVYYEKCLKQNETNNEAKRELNKCNQRLSELREGLYNFESLYQQAVLKRECLLLDVADFTSLQITIGVEIDGKGKGVRAVEFIKQGTLLHVSKALTAAFYNKLDYSHTPYSLNVYLDQMRYNTRNESENLACLIERMRDDPSLAKQVYSLYGGEKHGRTAPFKNEDNNSCLIDIERLEAIYAFNSFQIKNSIETLNILSLEEEAKCLSCYDEEDFNEVELSLINFNSVEYKQLQSLQTKFNNLNRQSGLWHKVAYFNHSCLSNVNLITVGDVMILRAQRNIEKGEECTIR